LVLAEQVLPERLLHQTAVILFFQQSLLLAVAAVLQLVHQLA
jgi:hypothetical protein